MRIIFMGSPDFAVDTLDLLYRNEYNIVTVITATDKLGGRGRKKKLETAVKKYALEHQIPILQPRNLKSKKFHKVLRALNADLQVVVAFRMLPESVWDMPPLGTINLHASLLPAYRGAAPINWAIMKGETETGLTTFKIQKEIDTGDILFQQKMEIGPDETAGSLYNRMKKVGARLVLKSVQAIENGTATYTVQDNQSASPAPKIHDEICKIDFDKSMDEVYNHIRGLSPYPAAWTTIDEKRLKVFSVKKNIEKTSKKGWYTDNKRILRYYLSNGYIDLIEVQLEGKKKMNIGDLLNGLNLKEPQLLE